MATSILKTKSGVIYGDDVKNVSTAQKHPGY